MLLVAAAFSGGCNILGPILYLTSPPQIKKAEYRIPEKQRVGIFIEYARPEQENPVLTEALHSKLEELLAERKVATDIVPLEDVYGLRRGHSDFGSWGLQRIGRRLDADYLIYIRITELRMRASVDNPIIEPSVTAMVKLISTDKPSNDARVWPGADEREGRETRRARAFREATAPLSYDDEAAKLGKDLAYLVIRPFYDVDEEEAIPWEP